MLYRLIKNKIAKNAGWLIGGHIAQMLISFIVSILTARYLGPDNYGLISYGTAYISFFTSFCTLGINAIIVKELINNRENEGKIMGTAIGLKAISSFLSAITIVLLVFFIDKGDPVAIKVVAICSLGLILKVTDVFTYWFQSYLKSKITAIVGLIGYLVISIYKVILIVTMQSVYWFAFSTSLDYFLVGFILWLIYKKQKGQKLVFSRFYAKKLLKSSWNFILPSLMVSIYAQTDKFMLKQMLGDSEVGFYATAVALTNMWGFVMQAIIDSLNPSIMEDHKANNREKYIQKNKLLYAIVFYVSMIVSLLYCLLSKPMIYILYGEAYLPAYMPLCVITWYSAFSYLGVARNTWVVCENKQKYLIWLYISAATTNIILNLILIPYAGVVGAAFASLLAQVMSSIIAPCFIKSMRPNAILMFEAIILKGILPKKSKDTNNIDL